MMKARDRKEPCCWKVSLLIDGHTYTETNPRHAIVTSCCRCCCCCWNVPPVKNAAFASLRQVWTKREQPCPKVLHRGLIRQLSSFCFCPFVYFLQIMLTGVAPGEKQKPSDSTERNKQNLFINNLEASFASSSDSSPLAMLNNSRKTGGWLMHDSSVWNTLRMETIASCSIYPVNEEHRAERKTFACWKAIITGRRFSAPSYPVS